MLDRTCLLQYHVIQCRFALRVEERILQDPNSLLHASSTTLLKISTNSPKVLQLRRAMPLVTTDRVPPIVRKLQTILIAIETSHF